MQEGLGNSSSNTNRVFLSVAFGKLRQKSLSNGTKVDENTIGAVKRITKQKAETWALEFDNICGRIESVFYKDNSGTDFSSSFEAGIKVGNMVYQISFTEDSKFWYGFMRCLPNININDPIRISVYDYETKDHKKKSGISIEQDENPKTRAVSFKDGSIHNYVVSYYKEYDEVGKKWNFLHGYPTPASTINWNDKDETTIYFTLVKVFLRKQFNELFKDKFVKTQIQEPESIVDPIDDSYPSFSASNVPEENDYNSDLPF
jgi:hypothetical protein